METDMAGHATDMAETWILQKMYEIQYDTKKCLFEVLENKG